MFLYSVYDSYWKSLDFAVSFRGRHAEVEEPEANEEHRRSDFERPRSAQLPAKFTTH